MPDDFQFDVFLSHADKDKPQVRQLAERLQKAGVRVWFDDWVIKAGDDIQWKLEQGLDKTRVLVFCLSQAALESEWAGVEVRTMMFRDPSNKNRSFIPLLLDQCERPSSIRRFKYVDYRQETDAAFVELLDACRAGSPPEGPSGPAVFLAEVFDDTYDQWELVKSYLGQVGYRVLTATTYSRIPSVFAKAMDEDLAQCDLFVQMLGRFGTQRTPELPGGYEGLQYECALAAKKEVLRRRSHDLQLAKVPDVEQRRLLEGADVKALDLEALKGTIVKLMRVLAAKPDKPSAASKLVLLNAAKEDFPLADDIAKDLATWNVDSFVRSNCSLQDLADTKDYNAFLLLYGNCQYEWVHERVLGYRKIRVGNPRAPACGIYIGPPENKEPFRCWLPNVSVIERQDRAQLQAFINSF